MRDKRAAVLWAAAIARDSGRGEPAHSHGLMEVGIVLSGRHEIHYEGHAIACTPGSVWFCAAGERHGDRTTASGTRFVVLRFAPEFIGEEVTGPVPWVAPFSSPPQQRPQIVDGRVRHSALIAGQLIWTEVVRKASFWENAVRFELLRLLLDLTRSWSEAASRLYGGDAHGSTTDLARIMPALSLVRSEAGRRIPAAEAAAACGLSLSGFHGAFRQALGSSFGAFQRRSRLLAVAQLLRNTSRTVSSIARETGFVDDSHLRRRFLAEFGYTPVEYRTRFRLGRRFADEEG